MGLVENAKLDYCLRISGLRKAFGGQSVLRRVEADVRKGDVVLLRGPNGSGKTTLLNILTGNIAPDAGTIELFTNGGRERFTFPRRWWRNLDPFDHFTPERVAVEGVGRTWQELRLFSTLGLIENIAVATPGQPGENPGKAVFCFRSVRRRDAVNLSDAAARLEKLGLAGRGTSSADMISLGQSKRVAIARSIQAGAQILLLDEPLSGLDASGVQGVMQMLRELVQQSGLTLIIVEHVLNLPSILELATTVWTLRDGELVVENLDSVQPTNYGNATDPIWAALVGSAGEHGRVRRLALPGGASLLIAAPNAEDTSQPVLDVRDVVVRRGRRLVIGEASSDDTLKGVSFSLRRGEIGLLQAPNGWGKTTLLEALAGELPLTRGEVRVDGASITMVPTWTRAKRGVSLLQARNHVFGTLTVGENLKIGGVREIPTGLRRLSTRKGCDLSGGEKQKVAVANALAGRGFCVGLLDEPCSALDHESIAELCNTAAAIREKTALLITVPSRADLSAPLQS